MKSLMAAKTPPASPATAAETANATVRISVGSRPIDCARHLGIAHRAHGLAPWARLQARVEPEGERAVSSSDEHGDLALGELAAGEARRRDADQAVPAAGRASRAPPRPARR